MTKDQQWIAKMREACENSLKLVPASAGANTCLGMLEAGTGHYEDAASHFQLALDADPTNDFAYRQLGNAYEQLGRLELAERTYQKAIQVHPEDATDYTWLGGLYNREAHYAAAAAQFEHAVKLAPDDAGDWLRLGGTYLLAGLYPKAENALQKAISLRPSYDAYSNLGTTYFLERKFPDAIAAFEQSSALGGRQIMAYGNLVCRPSQFFTTAHLVEDNVGGGLPDERFGRVVPACKPRIDGAFQFFHRVEGAPPNHFVSDEPKPAFNLIEPGTAGGCEMEVKAAGLLGLGPTLHAGALVGAVVVENEVDVEFRGHLLFQLMEEFDELLAPMARQATTDDLAIEDIEGGKQGGGSVPLVIMRLAFRPSRPQGQKGSGSVQRLDLALFIDAEY